MQFGLWVNHRSTQKISAVKSCCLGRFAAPRDNPLANRNSIRSVNMCSVQFVLPSPFAALLILYGLLLLGSGSPHMGVRIFHRPTEIL